MTFGRAAAAQKKKSVPGQGNGLEQGVSWPAYRPLLLGTVTVVVRVVALPAASRASTVMV